MSVKKSSQAAGHQSMFSGSRTSNLHMLHAEDSPWYCLHMEYLSPEDGWQHPADISPLLQSSAREAALAALETAHGLELKLAELADNLRHTAVHGDARSPNILMHACDGEKQHNLPACNSSSCMAHRAPPWH